MSDVRPGRPRPRVVRYPLVAARALVRPWSWRRVAWALRAEVRLDRARAVLAGHGLRVTGEHDLRGRRGRVPSRLVRLEFELPSGGRGGVSVYSPCGSAERVSLRDSDPRVEAPGTWHEFGRSLEEWRPVATEPGVFASVADLREVERLRLLVASDALLASWTFPDPRVSALLAPGGELETVDPARVAEALSVLRDLAAGAPLEWVLRRASRS